MDRRVKRTRMLIRTAFLELLKENDLSSLTITELTQKADIDRRTFYLHYSCLEDIIVEIETETANAMQEVVLSMKEFDIRTFFEGLTGIMAENLEFWRIISSNESNHRFLMRCKNFLRSSMHELFFVSSDLSEEDFEIYSEYVASGITGIYADWLMSRNPMPLEELTRKAEIAVAGGWNLITAGR